MKLILCLGLVFALSSCAMMPSKRAYDPDQVRKKVRDNMPEIEACYRKAMEKNPNLQGSLKLQWDILEDGSVSQVEVLKPFDPSLDQCVIGKLRGWTFAKPPQDQVVRVSYPFRFIPENEKLTE